MLQLPNLVSNHQWYEQSIGYSLARWKVIKLLFWNVPDSLYVQMCLLLKESSITNPTQSLQLGNLITVLWIVLPHTFRVVCIRLYKMQTLLSCCPGYAPGALVPHLSWKPVLLRWIGEYDSCCFSECFCMWVDRGGPGSCPGCAQPSPSVSRIHSRPQRGY